jgi:predicted phosphodiesterase
MGRARVVLFAFVGAVVAVLLAASVEAAVGPFDCTAVVRPSLRGTTFLRLPPLGSIELDTHTAPVRVELRVEELRADEAKRFVSDPELLEGLGDELAEDARAALGAVALRALLAAAVGGVVGALAARLSWRAALAGLVVGAVSVGAVGGAAALTFRPEAVAEPEYSGLLTAAPRAVGDVEALVERFDDYRAQLTGLVANVTALYRAAEGLPTFDERDASVRVLHIGDIHNNPQGYDLAAELVEQFDVDAVIDTGDTTDWGTPPEARLIGRIGDFDVPYVWVRGNHDSRTSTQRAVAAQGAIVLDNEAVTVAGLRIFGIGDPRYTPDKDQPTGHDVEATQIERFAGRVRGFVEDAGPRTIDVVAVHDRRAAAQLADLVPLVLAGHTHAAREERYGSTVVLTEGSTGGAGLRALEGQEPEPLAASILYFDDRTDRLVAYDRVTVDGFGGAGVRIERHTVEPQPQPADD